MSHWVDNLAWAHPAYINIAPFNIPVFHNILEYSYAKMGNTVLFESNPLQKQQQQQQPKAFHFLSS